MRRQIRLACRLCDRSDFDFIQGLPLDWFAVEEVQEFLETLRSSKGLAATGHPLWFTHLGVCPACYEAEIRPALTLG